MVGCLLRITVFIVILCKRRNYLNKELKNADADAALPLSIHFKECRCRTEYSRARWQYPAYRGA